MKNFKIMLLACLVLGSLTDFNATQSCFKVHLADSGMHYVAGVSVAAIGTGAYLLWKNRKKTKFRKMPDGSYARSKKRLSPLEKLFPLVLISGGSVGAFLSSLKFFKKNQIDKQEPELQEQKEKEKQEREKKAAKEKEIEEKPIGGELLLSKKTITENLSAEHEQNRKQEVIKRNDVIMERDELLAINIKNLSSVQEAQEYVRRIRKFKEPNKLKDETKNSLDEKNKALANYINKNEEEEFFDTDSSDDE